MKKRMFPLAAALLLALLLIAPSFTCAAVPSLINYQGELTDDAGTPLDGSYTMHFYLYDDSTSGILLWSEQQTVTVTGGIINVQLGADTLFAGDEVTGNRPVYLEVAILNTATHSLETLSPRQRLTATPFAMQAGNAELLNGMDETAFAATTHNHDSAYVNEGQVSSVNSAMIVDSTISASDIHGNTITADKVVPNMVSSVDGVTNDGGNIDLVPGSNITITPNNTANTITISAAAGVTDHGALTGLADDDHSQYLTENEGDIRYVNGSGDTMSGALSVTGSLYANEDLRIGTGGDGTDNDFLFMDSGVSQYFSWQDSQDTFYANNDLALLGVLQTGNSIANQGYNRLGVGIATSPDITDASDLLVSDDLEVGGDMLVHGPFYSDGHLFVGTNSGTDDDHIWMDGNNETFYWNESENRFRLSDDLWVEDNLDTGGNVNADGDVSVSGNFKYNSIRTFYLQIPVADFVPASETQSYFRNASSLHSFYSGTFYASVHLPQGAEVKNVTFYYYDNDPADSIQTISCKMLSRGTSEPEADTLFIEFVDDTTDAAYVRSISHSFPYASQPIIDNTSYQYGLSAHFYSPSGGPDHRFYGAKIEYSLQELMP